MSIKLNIVDCSDAVCCNHIGVADLVESDGLRVPLTMLDDQMEPQAYVLLNLTGLLGVIAMLEKRATELRRRG